MPAHTTADQALAEVRVRLLAELERFDDARFFTPPPGGGWGEVKGSTRAQLMERLATVRAGTVALLEETRARDLSRIYLRHPFFGAFPARDFLAWAAWHEDRHRRQLVRARVSLGLC